MSDFSEWLEKAEPGLSIVYFRGHLTSRKNPPQEDAQIAWAMACSGIVDLVQRKVGRKYEYIAIRRKMRDPMPVRDITVTLAAKTERVRRGRQS